METDLKRSYMETHHVDIEELTGIGCNEIFKKNDQIFEIFSLMGDEQNTFWMYVHTAEEMENVSSSLFLLMTQKIIDMVGHNVCVLSSMPIAGGQADASLIVFGDSVEEITNMFRTYMMHMK